MRWIATTGKVKETYPLSICGLLYLRYEYWSWWRVVLAAGTVCVESLPLVSDRFM